MRKIEKAAVIGSGIMGGGIAALLASAGIKTLLLDIVPFDLKDDEKNKPEARNRIVKQGLEATQKAKPALFMNKDQDMLNLEIGNLEDDFKKLEDCDWIVEVIVENLKIKQQLFTRIEKVMKKGAIISSNTSGLPLEKMAEGRSKEFKQHFLITHFFNPVRYMKLLEVVPGKETKKEILDFFEDWSEKTLGKGIVWAKDTPNFIGNRIGVQLICKSFQLLESENISIPTIDAMFGSNFGMPKTAMFGLADLVGLDTIGHLAKNSYELLAKDEQREVYKLPKFITDMIDKKLLGNKTKAGFYKKEVDLKTWKTTRLVIDKTGNFAEYDRKAAAPPCAAKAKEAKTLAEKQQAIVYGDDPASKFAWKLISSAMCYAANRVPEISDTIVGIDNAMKWGYNWEAGPFEIWDNIGLKESVKKMEADGLAIPKNIKKMIAGKNKTFYRFQKGKKQYYDFKSNSYKDLKYNPNAIYLSILKNDKKEVLSNSSASLIDIGDGVFCLEYHTKMNALNAEILDLTEKTGEYISKNGVGLVLGNQAPGMPGAYSAGADLGYMGDLAKKQDWKKLEDFISRAHKAFFGMKYSSYPVVAAPYGMTLGGGAETCLASDKIVAHAELYLGLVEIGAGLIPGGGGITNLWRKFIESVPKPVKITDLSQYFIAAFMNIAMAKVSMSAAEARNNGFLGPKDRIIFNKDFLLGEAKKEVLRMVEDGYTPPLKTKIPVMGNAAQGMIEAELFNMRNGGYITPHMEFIAKKIAYVMSGGEAGPGTLVSEDYMLKLERETFIELWKTENTQKMAEHIKNTGKPLLI